MKKRIRVQMPPSLSTACTGPHLPDEPPLRRPIERHPVDATGRPLNLATGGDVDRIIGMDKRGYPVPKGSPGDITVGAKLVRHEDDPPDPYGPEGDAIEPQPSEADALRERYGLDAEGFPLPADQITPEQRHARVHATITGPRQ